MGLGESWVGTIRIIVICTRFTTTLGSTNKLERVRTARPGHQVGDGPRAHDEWTQDNRLCLQRGLCRSLIQRGLVYRAWPWNVLGLAGQLLSFRRAGPVAGFDPTQPDPGCGFAIHSLVAEPCPSELGSTVRLCVRGNAVFIRITKCGGRIKRVTVRRPLNL